METKPGRKRSESAKKAILEAALRLARGGGYASVTMEGIAAEAGVGKQTIYRWWPSRGAVVLEAAREAARAGVPVPDRGSLRGDLRAFLRALFGAVSRDYAEILRGLMAEAQLDRTFRDELKTLFLAPRRLALRAMFERAQLRGETNRKFDPDLGVDLAYGVLWYRLLADQGPLDSDAATALADAIADAAVRGQGNG